MDGYFQDSELYSQIGDSELSAGMKRIRRLLDISDEATKDSLCHIRLSDFFETDIQRVEVARKKLARLEYGTEFISSDDALIRDDEECQKLIDSRKLSHVLTYNFTAEEVFLLMCKYRKVESNNSTLAFWAAVLGGAELKVDDKNLHNLFLRFRKSYIAPDL